MTEGVKVTGDEAYGRFHIHSAYAHVALALSQLFQSGDQLFELGELVRLESRYESPVSAHGSETLRISRPSSAFDA